MRPRISWDLIFTGKRRNKPTKSEKACHQKIKDHRESNIVAMGMLRSVMNRARRNFGRRHICGRKSSQSRAYDTFILTRDTTRDTASNTRLGQIRRVTFGELYSSLTAIPFHFQAFRFGAVSHRTKLTGTHSSVRGGHEFTIRICYFASTHDRSDPYICTRVIRRHSIGTAAAR